MNDSLSRQSSGFPSEEQMDGLLKDFFRLETPAALNQPFRLTAAEVNGASLNVVASRTDFDHADSAVSPAHSRRLIVASALTILAMSMLVLFNIPQAGSGKSGTAKAPDEVVAPADELMLVSPEADSRVGSRPISADGVTLEETDVIDLKPLN